jgi:hypothetical protein
MSIINGTFDEDISGWTTSGLITSEDGNSDVIWSDGRARLRVYQCSNASLSQTITVDNNSLLFDYQSTSDRWSEITYFRLMRGSEILVDIPLLYTTVSQPINVSASVGLDVSTYIGQDVTLIFGITQDIHCAYGDHANTYLYVDNIRLINEADNIVVSGFTVVPPTCQQPCDMTTNVTWTNNGTLKGLIYPAITVDGTRIPFSMPESILEIDPGIFVTKSLTLQNMEIGQHEICPSPNSGAPCTTITVNTPANITATNITADTMSCQPLCDTTVDVTWQNFGGTSGSFYPAIKINDVRTPLSIPEVPISIDPGLSTTKSFIVSGLIEGTYTVCPDPN